MDLEMLNNIVIVDLSSLKLHFKGISIYPVFLNVY